ncbi:MAG TPA: helix-turn-helix domain-containing protein [Vicinamibacterales bacterium]|jgi:DNA-binding HxlR family transcriptional regulator|nr:helix-turn-helix domain-containing protein [Vicinamibacterales bacterium]
MLKVTADSYEHAKDCPFRNVLDQVGDKWSFLIFAVLEEGPKRFNEIKRLVGDISHRVLTRKLRELERDGYVTRTVHPVRPPKVVYELTPLGRSILKPIKQFLKWTLDAFPEIKRAREAFDGAPASSRTPEPR